MCEMDVNMSDSVSGRRLEGSSIHFGPEEEDHSNVILDEFSSLEEVREAIKRHGLETCNLIFGKLVAVKDFFKQVLFIFTYLKCIATSTYSKMCLKQIIYLPYMT